MKEYQETITLDDGTGRSKTVTYATAPDYEDIPSELTVPYCQAMVEAQLLEQAIKQAIHNDVVVFAEENHDDLIDLLRSATMGRSIKILNHDSSGRKDRIIAECTGFYEFIKLGCTCLGRRDDLDTLFTEAKKRRNHIAHDFWYKVFSSEIDHEDVKKFLEQSRDIFSVLRDAIIQADRFSSMGAIGSDGQTIPRMPPEILRNNS